MTARRGMNNNKLPMTTFGVAPLHPVLRVGSGCPLPLGKNRRGEKISVE